MKEATGKDLIRIGMPSHKFENMHGCTFINWESRSNNGPGFWFDGVFLEDGGGNTNNVFHNLTIIDSVRTGLELELGTSSNRFYNTKIQGVLNLPSPDPATGWSQSAGIMIKRYSDDNLIDGATISRLRKGGVDRR